MPLTPPRRPQNRCFAFAYQTIFLLRAMPCQRASFDDAAAFTMTHAVRHCLRDAVLMPFCPMLRQR